MRGLEEQLAKVKEEEEGKEGELSALQGQQQQLTSTITAKEEQLQQLQQQLQEVIVKSDFILINLMHNKCVSNETRHYAFCLCSLCYSNFEQIGGHPW